MEQGTKHHIKAAGDLVTVLVPYANTPRNVIMKTLFFFFFMVWILQSNPSISLIIRPCSAWTCLFLTLMQLDRCLCRWPMNCPSFPFADHSGQIEATCSALILWSQGYLQRVKHSTGTSCQWWQMLSCRGPMALLLCILPNTTSATSSPGCFWYKNFHPHSFILGRTRIIRPLIYSKHGHI